jgi:hypothetical protein
MTMRSAAHAVAGMVSAMPRTTPNQTQPVCDSVLIAIPSLLPPPPTHEPTGAVDQHTLLKETVAGSW